MKKPRPLSDYRPTAEQTLSALFARGGCSLYDTLSLAYQHVQRQQEEDPSRIAAIVVLSDGKDTTSKLTLEQLLAQIRYDFVQHTVRVFTIGYEAQNGTDVLKQIGEVTQGRYYEGEQTNIRRFLRIFRRSFEEFEERSQDPESRSQEGDAIPVTNGLGESALKPGTHLAAKRRFNIGLHPLGYSEPPLRG